MAALKLSVRRAGMKIGYGSTEDNDYTETILDQPTCKMSRRRIKIDLVKMSVAKLGFGARTPQNKIFARALEVGLLLCPWEAALHLRQAYKKQPPNDWLTMAMKPMIYRGMPVLAHISSRELRKGVERYLEIHATAKTYLWPTSERFVFVKPRK
jgi:hypothetical protein